MTLFIHKKQFFDVIIDNCIPSWSWHALSWSNRYQVEFIGILLSDLTINHCSWKWIRVATWLSSKQSSVDSLAAIDVHEFAWIGLTTTYKSLFNLSDFRTADTFDLAFSYTISVEDYLSRIRPVSSLKSLTCVSHSLAQIIWSFLTNIILYNTGRPKSSRAVVHRSSEC